MHAKEETVALCFMGEKCNRFRLVGPHAVFVSLCITFWDLMVQRVGTTATGFTDLDDSGMH